jgi:hypothetical protein
MNRPDIALVREGLIGRWHMRSILGFGSGLAIVVWSAVALGQTTYYVRTDGGSPAECTGTADAAHPGAGTGQSCAWDHPFRALSPDGSLRIAGGDTLVIGPGSYRMGFGAPGADSCEAEAAYDCVMPPPPSGPDADHPTRLVGAGWQAGCANPPELWGAERAWQVLDLAGASHVVVACLEITDHSTCVEDHTGDLACERDTPPYGDWAAVGLSATDSADVLLRDLDVHGLAVGGIHAGRLTDWALERVQLVANGWSGWDGDVDGDDSNDGDLVFDRVEIAWNGCGETWPGEEPVGCWDQSAGGYGDGLGTGATVGRWLFQDCTVMHNTSDGLDLYYLQTGGSVEVRRTISRGNAGDQLKVAGDATVVSSLLVSDCAFFDGWPLMSDHCRGGGSAFLADLHPGSRAAVVSSTLASEGDCVVIAECTDTTCSGAEELVIRGSVLVGATDYWQPFESSCLYWWDDSQLPTDPVDLDWNLVSGVKDQDEVCPRGAHDLCVSDPMLADATIDGFDGHLVAGGPGVDSGLPVGTPVGATAVPADDLEGHVRPTGAGVDRGAYELGSGGPARDLHPADAWVIPAVASAAGAAGTYWSTQLVVVNPGDQATTVTVTYTPRGEDGSSVYESTSVSFAPGSTRTWDDPLLELFGHAGVGALELRGPGLAVDSRTWTPAADGGGYGQGIPSLASNELLTLDREPEAMAGGVVEDAAFRTNLGLCEVWGETVTVRIEVLDEAGVVLGSLDQILWPFENLQINRVVTAVTGSDAGLQRGAIRLRAVSGGGRLGAYLSLVDAVTGDPTYRLVAPRSPTGGVPAP